MTLPLTGETKQFIIDHWAAIQPKDIGANWNVTGVEFEGSDVLVTCHTPVPPSPRIVRVPMARVEAWGAQMGYPAEPAQVVTVDYELPAVNDEGEPEPAKPKRSTKK